MKRVVIIGGGASGMMAAIQAARAGAAVTLLEHLSLIHIFYHIVADGAEQIVKPAQAAVVTRVLEAIYESAKSGKTIYFD